MDQGVRRISRSKRIKEILKTIEKLRGELESLAEYRSQLIGREVIRKSQELDRLLVQYYKLLNDEEQD